MNTQIICFALAGTLAACAPTTDPEAETDSVTSAITELTIDSSALTTIPTGTIPANRLTLAAFDDTVVASRLIETPEPFARVEAVSTRRFLDSTSWSLETDPRRGSVLVMRKTKGGVAAALDPVVLQREALARLSSWGLLSTEVGTVLQRKTMAHDEDRLVGALPRVLSHKTFVFRQVLGVPVEEHRAVVTHALDGSFQRARVKWPALAASGHLLHTRLGRAEIEARAAAALGREGITSGAIALRWRYVASPASVAGEVVLKLVVAARVPSVDGVEVDEEARDLDVDVSAVP